MRRILFEARIAVPLGVWAIPLLFAVMRVAGAIWVEGWVPLMALVFPVPFPLLAVRLLDQERRRRTSEVLIAAPGAKPAVLATRIVAVLLPLFAVAAASTRPQDWILVLPGGVLLAGFSLLVGLLVGSEVGLAVALGWWGFSSAAALGLPALLTSPLARWLLLSSVATSLDELHVRNVAHLGCGLVLLAVCSLLYGRRSWRGFRY